MCLADLTDPDSQWHKNKVQSSYTKPNTRGSSTTHGRLRTACETCMSGSYMPVGDPPYSPHPSNLDFTFLQSRKINSFKPILNPRFLSAPNANLHELSQTHNVIAQIRMLPVIDRIMQLACCVQFGASSPSSSQSSPDLEEEVLLAKPITTLAISDTYVTGQPMTNDRPR